MRDVEELERSFGGSGAEGRKVMVRSALSLAGSCSCAMRTSRVGFPGTVMVRALGAEADERVIEGERLGRDAEELELDTRDGALPAARAV